MLPLVSPLLRRAVGQSSTSGSACRFARRFESVIARNSWKSQPVSRIFGSQFSSPSSLSGARAGALRPSLRSFELSERSPCAHNVRGGFGSPCQMIISTSLLGRNFWSGGGGLQKVIARGGGASWQRPRSRVSVPWARRRGSGYRNFGSGGYIDPQLALGALIATNVGVFFLWRSLGGSFMQNNFVVSAQALREGRLHTLVTSAFSQITLNHLLSNMVGLYFFGSEIGNLFGGRRLLLLYLTGGVVGSLTHLGYWAYVMPWIEGYPRRSSGGSAGLLGASGAVNAIILLDILLFPTRIVYLNLIIPVPAAVLGVLVIGSDLWAARDGRQNTTSAAAHLGGAFVGALAFLRWR